VRFLHGADIHLDGRLEGLERYEGAPVDRIRTAPRQALVHLVDLALDQQVDFVLLSGDIYDGDWRDHGTGLFFASEMARLNRADIPVYLIQGNHDAQNKMTRSVPLPDNVRVFSHEAPETFTLEGLDVALHGQSFATQAVTANLARSYPDPLPGHCNIGLLHTSLTGREGHENYAPCSVADLESKGYDYWALGHVHTREAVSDDPPIHFPGNVQGRHIRETGPKGCLVVDGAPGRFAVQFHELGVMRWDRCTLAADDEDADPVTAFAEALPAILADAPDKLFALRVHIGGPLAGHPRCQDDEELYAGLCAVANDVGDGCAWVEKVVVQPVVRTARAVFEGPVEHALAALEAPADDAESARVLDDIEKIVQRLPASLRKRPGIAEWTTTEGQERLRREAAGLLRQRLGFRGDDHAD